MGFRHGRFVAALIAAAALTAAPAAEAAGDVSFFIDASTGPGFGLYRWLSGVGEDFAGFAFHMQTCLGARFLRRFGLGAGGAFQPLVAQSGFFGGGYAGACFVVEPIERLHFEATAGFGGVGATGAATIGPALAAGASYDVVGDDKVRMFLGLRVLALPGWNNGRSGFYVSPTFSIGVRYW